jgi:hypothetical protein
MLVMSATPIPRSLALTIYGDLDLSVIDEMPPGRHPVRTGVRSYADRDAALNWIRQELAAGRQAYFVYPLIEESETVEATAVKDAVEELRDRFPEFVVESVHGRMPSARKEETMRRFAAGEISLLVATTVIEVGMPIFWNRRGRRHVRSSRGTPSSRRVRTGRWRGSSSIDTPIAKCCLPSVDGPRTLPLASPRPVYR